MKNKNIKEGRKHNLKDLYKITHAYLNFINEFHFHIHF